MKKSQLSFKRAMLLTLAFLFQITSFTSVQAAGEVDPNFKVAVQDTFRGAVQKIVVQPNGKIVAAGNFTVANNSARTSIARFNADGSVDQTFNPPDFVALTSLGYRIDSVTINAIAVQADEKVLLAGNFFRVNNQNRRLFIRLNADGSFDSAFAPTLGTEETVTDIKVQPNGQIVYSGSIAASGGGQGLTRLNSDGSTDTSLQFNRRSRVDSFLIQADGKFIVNDSLGGAAIYRVNTNGSIDNSFTPATAFNIASIALQPDGKILIGGSFRSVNGIGRGGVARLNTDGSLDPLFNQIGPGVNGAVVAIDVTSDGKVFIVGTFTTFSDTSRLRNARLNSNGTLDTSFNYNPEANATINTVAATGDGGVILGGGNSVNKLSRLNADGSVNTNFVAAIYHVGVVRRMVRQSDGKILVAGNFGLINGVSRSFLARLNSDGSVDTGFNGPVPSIPTSLAVQPDGKILVGGSGVYRLNSNGSFDSSFQAFQSISINRLGINEIAVQSNGKIIVAGYIETNSSKIAVMRLNADGTEDTTFNRVLFNFNADSRVLVMKIQPDGKPVIGGIFSQINGISRLNLARINTDGTLDSSFNLVLGVAGGPVRDLALQSNGNIIIGGDFSNVNGTANYYYLARILPNATLDTSFNPGPNAQVYAVAVQSDDKILIGGVFDAIGGASHSKIARLNSNGSLDTAFATNANDVVSNIYSSTDGKTLVSGDFNRINGTSSVGLARLFNTAASLRTLFDFDGDGRADVAVFRPSTGYWFTSQNSAINYGAVQFGVASDKLVPADYDGDGKTDVAVNRNGTWYIQQSTAGFTGISFGDGNDIPVPADYDGDGKADIAVFRPSNGTWYLLQSTNGFAAIALGLGTDKPVPADYNGDGRAEVAVFRPSNGFWYLSTNPATGYGGVQFGSAEDKPVPADYDGDGKTDLAVFRPSNGTWYLLQSTAGFTGVTFGFGTDLPVAADYDGDGKADIAIFRQGNWYLQRSTQGFTGIQFGVGDDKPIPYSFIR